VQLLREVTSPEGEQAVKLLTFKELQSEKGISESDVTLWRRVKAGQFPKPVKNGRRNYWIEAEIDRHLESLVVQRESAQ
jgi:predicted DNA-binding transcriptional regulator AlpA